MNADARGLLALAAVAGGLVFFAPSNPAPQPKQSTPAVKTAVVPKQSAPSQRTVPTPRPRPPAAISRPERKAKKAATRPRTPTASECAQMRSAGRSVVLVGGRVRGYSDDQINRALAHCRI